MKALLGTTPDLFRAFADTTRLRLLNLLLEQEVCVCNLCETLGQSQPKVSRHLAYLRRAGLVTMREEGKWKFYKVVQDAAGLEQSLLACVKSRLRDIDVLRDDLVRLRALTAGSSCA